MTGLSRIIDASANRAREALRVLEDLARFELDDAALTADLKALRHDFTSALTDALAEARLDRLDLLTSRDTPGDVGTAISTPQESARVDSAAVASAAAGRLTEALRSIEESLKALAAPGGARSIEAARYRCYTLEKTLLLRLARPRRQWSLCVLLSAELCPRGDWESVAAAALGAGADCIQLREKTLPDRELLARASRLVQLARATGADVIINDRPDIALLSGARGVHLGQDDLPVAAARRILAPRMLVGVSTSNPEQARAAVEAGADYCGVGPMFPSTTKHKSSLSGPGYLRAYLGDALTAPVPHLAISGITPANAPQLSSAGCRGLAVSSAICAAPDPAAVCTAFLRLLRDYPAPRPDRRTTS